MNDAIFLYDPKYTAFARGGGLSVDRVPGELLTPSLVDRTGEMYRLIGSASRRVFEPVSPLFIEKIIIFEGAYAVYEGQKFRQSGEILLARPYEDLLANETGLDFLIFNEVQSSAEIDEIIAMILRGSAQKRQ
jgi:hypothetical protein